jgi:hypothetical protein
MSLDLVAKVKLALFGRQRAYQSTFRDRDGQIVLEDLAQFCRLHESTFHPDARIAANLDGRREVILRICNHLNLDQEALWALHGSKSE